MAVSHLLFVKGAFAMIIVVLKLQHVLLSDKVFTCPDEIQISSPDY